MPVDVQKSEYAYSYTSMAGTDIKAVLGGVTLGEMQAISIQVTREKAGIYTMGSPEPRSFSRGKRGIAGSMIVIQFDRDAITDALRSLKFQGDIDELRPEYAGGTSLEWELRAQQGSRRTASSPIGGPGITPPNSPALSQQESNLTSVESDQIVMEPFYADQIPPFDITLTAANEYGDLAVARVYGVEFLNEGWGISIDDLVSEKQYTYLARKVSWWRHVQNPNVALMYDTGVGR